MRWRKTDGSRYPPNSLRGIVASIQHKFNKTTINLRVWEMRWMPWWKSGLGLTKKQGEVITLDEEEELWGKGVLGDSNPQQLLDTMVYLFGIHFEEVNIEDFGQKIRKLLKAKMNEMAYSIWNTVKMFLKRTLVNSKTECYSERWHVHMGISQTRNAVLFVCIKNILVYGKPLQYTAG